MKKILSCLLLLGAFAAANAQTVQLDEAIAQSSAKIGESLARGTRVAVINCTSSSAKLSDYIIGELVFSLVESGRVTVVEREDIQLVKDELQFQISGDVSDESAQSIGKLLGAEVIVTCAFDETATLRVKVIAVETARLIAVCAVPVQQSEELASLTENLVLVLDCAVNGADQALGSTVTGLMVSAVSGSPGFRAVSNESRGRALGQKQLTLSDLTDESTRSRVSKMTAAGSMLLGKISLEGGLWFFTITQVNVGDGTIAASNTETYRSSGTLIEGASGQVRRCLGVQASVDERRVITVGNMTELLQSIGPDRVIKIAPGNYDLTKGYEVKNKYVTWVNEYDGPCPVIKSVSNLAFIGEGNPVIMIKPAYGWVFSFETCSNIRISGLVFGHTVPGYCLGGVLRFKNCDDTEIRSCELYGSGTYGLGLERATKFVMEDCVIHDCTYGLATIENCSDLTFTKTAFNHTGEFDLISVTASDHLAWTDCRFEGNWGPALFSVDGESRDLRLTGCIFVGNKVDVFCDNDEALVVEGARYKGNRFKPYGQ